MLFCIVRSALFFDYCTILHNMTSAYCHLVDASVLTLMYAYHPKIGQLMTKITSRADHRGTGTAEVFFGLNCSSRGSIPFQKISSTGPHLKCVQCAAQTALSEEAWIEHPTPRGRGEKGRALPCSITNRRHGTVRHPTRRTSIAESMTR